MAGIKVSSELRDKLIDAQSAQEAKDILVASGQECGAQDAERIWQEIEDHKVDYTRDVSDSELESVAGGVYKYKDGEDCAATVEYDSWCKSNDACLLFDVVYEDYPMFGEPDRLTKRNNLI